MEVHRDRYGRFHREDGPAIIRHDGSEFWYVHGKLHREDGPAVVYYTGTQQWWLYDKQVDPMKHLVLTSSNKGV